MPPEEIEETTDPREVLEQALRGLIEKAPDSLRPLAVRYGPVLLNWSYDELWAWIELASLGKWQEAQTALLRQLSDGDLVAELEAINLGMAEANINNKQEKELLQQATIAILRGVLSLVLLMVGL